MPFRFDLIDLHLFIRVVEGGSITAGAEAMRMALGAASARLGAMEDSLAAPLLRRMDRGVQPTAAGEALLLQARRLMAQIEQLNGDLGPHGGGLKAQLRLWCNTVALQEQLPGLLADYLARHPHVNIEVQEREGSEVVRALAEGRADVGFVRENTDTLGLETHELPPDQLALVTPPGHALSRAPGPVMLEQADDCDVVGLQSGVALQDIWDTRVAQRGRRLNYRVRVTGFDAQCRLVARGAGIALMPLGAARRHGRGLDIRVVPLADRYANFRLRLCVRPGVDDAGAVRGLVQSVLQAAAEGAA